jgi:signal transduction histidine kinase
MLVDASAEIVRSHARLRVLAEMSHAFASVASDYRLLIETIARTTAALIGDGCLVTLLDAGGENLVNAASAHRDLEIETAYRAYLVGVGISKTTSKAITATVVRTGEPMLVAELQPEVLVAQSDDALKPLVARLNVHSFAVVPIRARQTIIGTLSLLRSGPGRGYTSDDLVLMLDLADRAGLAIENARLVDELEQRVRQRTAELEHVNQELEAFSYSIAHDLRAPVRRIDGFSQALREECADRLDTTGTRYLTHICRSAQQMGALIDGLLELARVTRVEVRRDRVNLSALAHSVLARLRAFQPDREVEIVVESGLEAHADARLLDAVFTNLLGNAWKFTSKCAATRIEFGQRSNEHPAIYFVRDNGVGFAPDDADAIFGVFRRLHASEEFEGTGIGLATVKRIIHRHGGRVWAEGEPGRGATIYFTLETGLM